MEPDFKFLVGHWQAPIWNGEFFERWDQATDGTLHGMGRHEQDGRVHFVEFMSVERTGDQWIMLLVLGLLSQGHKTPVPFELAASGPNFVEFVNERNAFPMKIVYRGVDENNLECTLEPGPNSSEERTVFAFRRLD